MAQVVTKPAPPPKNVPPALAPLPPSPQEFYATVTKRPDIREILKRLAGV